VKREENLRTRHDEWTKDALSLWLDGVGEVRVDARITGSTRRGDVLFTETKRNGHRRKTLGLLGKLARGCVLFEAFRNPVSPWEIETCLVKSIEHTAQQMRAARRAKQKQSTTRHTTLCVITPSASEEVKTEAELTLLSLDQPGVYRMARLLHTVVVVVDKLPENESTLWFRLLGRDDVQRRAVEELCKMQANKALGSATLELLIAWQQSLPLTVATNLEQEDSMSWRRVYKEWEQKTLKKGRSEGIVEGIAKGTAKGKVEGKAEAILIALNARGLTTTATQRKQILSCKDSAQLDEWLRKAIVATSVKALLEPSAPRRRSQRQAA
jgi:hypothetical protein